MNEKLLSPPPTLLSALKTLSLLATLGWGQNWRRGGGLMAKENPTFCVTTGWSSHLPKMLVIKLELA